MFWGMSELEHCRYKCCNRLTMMSPQFNEDWLTFVHQLMSCLFGVFISGLLSHPPDRKGISLLQRHLQLLQKLTFHPWDFSMSTQLHELYLNAFKSWLYSSWTLHPLPNMGKLLYRLVWMQRGTKKRSPTLTLFLARSPVLTSYEDGAVLYWLLDSLHLSNQVKIGDSTCFAFLTLNPSSLGIRNPKWPVSCAMRQGHWSHTGKSQ